MGGCLSRKKGSLNANDDHVSVAAKEPVVEIKSFNDVKIKKQIAEDEQLKKKPEEEEKDGLVKKDVILIKHRKSHDKERVLSTQNAQKIASLAEDSGNFIANSNNNDNPNNIDNINNEMGSGLSSSLVVRASSCSKEEVDAILIQCGRLSRSNSAGKAAPTSDRKYSGSKRSYDMDQEHDADVAVNGSYGKNDDEEDELSSERRQHRQRHRQPSSPSSSSKGRRRTPSRERDQRSGSRERGNNGGRRVSRSPGRRSENNGVASSLNGNSNASGRPGKMVSVPATVSSLTMERSNNAVEPEKAKGVKQASVKRNGGVGDAGMAGSRGAASPRSRSPARVTAKGGSNENNPQQQPSLSRSSSRKAEQSPYRRNALSEVDMNSLVYAQTSGNNRSRGQSRKRELEESNNVLNQGQMQKTSAQGANKAVKEQNVIVEAAGGDLRPQSLTRSRSARRSRDLDETLLNPNATYTALLLDDIQNFHQKSTNTNTPSFSVPECVTKACSILEAVADLNSTTSLNVVEKKPAEAKDKDPFVESEVVVDDDLMEPSLHKYVTVRRGGGNGRLCTEDMDGQESSGSNSFVGDSQQHWGYSTSSWEPSSADSTDRWTSRSNDTRDMMEQKKSPLGLQKQALAEAGRDLEEARRGFCGQRNGIGRGRVGSGLGKNVNSASVVAAAAST